MIHLEIWSDIVCPFCYIGKRHLELALGQFENRGQVRVVWKSFELDPGVGRDLRTNVHEMLSKKYGQSVAWAKQMTGQVAQKAASVGLRIDFDRVILTNSFDGHRLIHLAAKHGIADQAEERLFSAHFIEGKHVGDTESLQALGAEIGLQAEEVRALLSGDEYASEVRRDEEEASSLGITGVPFFLFDRRHAVSGAQPVEVFIKALRACYRGSI